MKKKIAVIAGGYSGEYEISLLSAQGILSWIDRDLFEPYLMLIEKNRWYISIPSGKDNATTEFPVDRNIFGFHAPGEPEPIRFDYAFITLHGTPGENGLLQGYLDMIGIPYNTGGTLCEALTFDKYTTNRFLSHLPGVRVAKSRRLTKDTPESNIEEIVAELGLPVFVKPNVGGSSVATTKVKSIEELLPAIRLVFDEAPEALIESFIEGTDVTCGCYRPSQPTGKDTGGLRALPVSEVVPKNEFFDFEAKYHGAVEEITPARISPDLTQEIQLLTRLIYLEVMARGIIRVDFIITPDGSPILLEVNTTPGMTPTSFIPQQVAAAQLEMPAVLTDIISQSIDIA